jgi:hypothetical protein
MCITAAQQLHEEYANDHLINDLLKRRCENEQEYEAMWTAFGKFIKIDRWMSSILDELRDGSK